jgi:hypothetical protein
VYELLKLSKRNLSVAFRVNLCKSFFKSLFWNLLLGVSEEHLNFLEGDHLIAIDIELVEEPLKLLLSHKLLTIDASKNEFTVSDPAIFRLVRHMDQRFNLFLVKVMTVVLSISIKQLFFGQVTIATGVQRLEYLLKFLRITYV